MKTLTLYSYSEVGQPTETLILKKENGTFRKEHTSGNAILCSEPLTFEEAVAFCADIYDLDCDGFGCCDGFECCNYCDSILWCMGHTVMRFLKDE